MCNAFVSMYSTGCHLRLPPALFRVQSASRLVPSAHAAQDAELAAAPVDLACRHFAQCSGCALASDLQRPPILATAGQFFKAQGLQGEFESTLLAAEGWRCRARLAVRADAAGAVQIGLFKSGSHKVQPIPGCPIHHPSINRVADLLAPACAAHGVSAYSEPRIERTRGTPRRRRKPQPLGTGLLRYVQLTAVARDQSLASTPSAQHDASALVQVVLVANCEASDRDALAPLERLVADLYRLHGSGGLLHSVWINFQGSPGNSILSGSWQLLHGAPWTWQNFGGANIALAPGSFVQVQFLAHAQAAPCQLCAVLTVTDIRVCIWCEPRIGKLSVSSYTSDLQTLSVNRTQNSVSMLCCLD